MTGLPNQNQSAAERAYKYNLLRELGLTKRQADRLRDWHYSSIDRRIHMFIGGSYNSRFRLMRYRDREEGNYVRGYKDNEPLQEQTELSI